MRYRRVLLKLSGETLAGEGNAGISYPCLQSIADEIKKLVVKKRQVAIVIGAGNLWRGAGKAIDRVTADYMGMLATVMNSLALRDVLEKNGLPARVQSAVEVPRIAELYVRDRAVELLESNHIVILAGGTGNPYFTTDTTAALRAAEIRADVLLKATQVDGVYDDDPKKNPGARRYARLTFDEAIQRRLKVMDTTAFSLCRENNIPLIVFDFHRKGNLARVLSNPAVGTVVSR